MQLDTETASAILKASAQCNAVAEEATLRVVELMQEAIDDRQRIADLESLLHDVDACLEWVWPHFGGDQADKIAALQKRIIDAVSN